MQGMRDMFIQSQLGTSSSGQAHKKRKADQYETVSWTSEGDARPGQDNSPARNQPFLRASTIKLLDSYQRCGQKVGGQLVVACKFTVVTW